MTREAKKRLLAESKKLKCENCGKPKHYEHAIYCSNCGKKLPIRTV
ncbi:hypothetical protein ACY3E7_002205 [Listeria monocytogenes]